MTGGLLNSLADWLSGGEYFSLRAEVSALRAENAGLKNEIAQLKKLSEQDALTGVYNVRGWWKWLEGKASRSHAQPLCVLSLDLDKLKIINDTCGHAAGDHVLRAVALRLAKNIRPDDDRVGRTGGDEFVVGLPNTSLIHAQVVAERIRTALAAPIAMSDGPIFSVTASIGVAIVEPGEHHTAKKRMNAALMAADAAMYTAKKRGGNHVVAA